ncbi:MAG: hypothetical protein J6Z11_03985 [Candidatus Riflebacteria bacterium]|nr:hypothetical protein [Candidatus Riflebacteria bacterium]
MTSMVYRGTPEQLQQNLQRLKQQNKQQQQQALNSPWAQNLMKAAGYVQNGGNNAYKKYNPNATSTQQQKMAQQYSTQQQNPGTSNQRDWERGIMSDPIGPTNNGNSNYNGLGNAIKTQTQPVSNNQTINNMANANQIPTGLRVNVSSSNQTNSSSQNGNNELSSGEKMSLPSFVNWGGEGNHTAYFNPTMATTDAPSYTQKEGSYGTYDTGIGKQKTYAQEIGSLGGKTDANGNYIDLFEQIAQGVDVPTGPSSNVTNAYVNLDDTLEQMAGSADVEAAPDSGYQKRDLEQGYTVDDLNLMAQNGFNTLGDAYQNALNKAAANYNRLGLRGSGFELADEFGNQTDSITSNYLKNVQQLQNDIATKGLEAAREDTYKNADANDANRLNWANYITNLAQQNYSNKGQLAGLQQNFGDRQNSNELDWDKYLTSVKQNNITNLEDALKLYQSAMGQSHGQQIDYGNLNGGLAAKDWEAIKGIWDSAIKNDQFTAEQKNEILKTILVSLATGTAGSNENYNSMINQFGNYSDYVKDLMSAAGYQTQQ